MDGSGSCRVREGYSNAAHGEGLVIFFWKLQSRGTPLRLLRLKGWTLQTTSPRVAGIFVKKLGQVVETIEDEDTYSDLRTAIEFSMVILTSSTGRVIAQRWLF